MQAKEGVGTRGGLGRWDLYSIDCSGVPPSCSHTPKFGGAAAPSLPRAGGMCVWGLHTFFPGVLGAGGWDDVWPSQRILGWPLPPLCGCG